MNFVFFRVLNWRWLPVKVAAFLVKNLQNIRKICG